MRPVLLTLSLALALLSLPSSGHAAMSCSQRNQECIKFCETKFSKSPGCTAQCADAMPRCMQDGCWITRMTNKCGYTKS